VLQHGETMTSLQNDPEQHQREVKHRANRTSHGSECVMHPPRGGGATNRKFDVSRGSEWSPDSESALRELSKSGLASHFAPRTCDFASGARDRFRKSFRCRLEFVPRGSGAPRRGHVHPGPAKPDPVYYRSIIENTLWLALLGEDSRRCLPGGPSGVPGRCSMHLRHSAWGPQCSPRRGAAGTVDSMCCV
jgi:hypothetical protein